MQKLVAVTAIAAFVWQGRRIAAGEALEVPVLEALRLKQRHYVTLARRAPRPTAPAVAPPLPRFAITQAPGEPPALEPADEGSRGGREWADDPHERPIFAEPPPTPRRGRKRAAPDADPDAA